MKKNILLLLLATLLISCFNSGKKSLVLTESTGKINQLLIVINHKNWNNNIGKAIRNIITKPVEGLPQEENQFSVTKIDPKYFNSIFTNSSNILFVGIGKKNSFTIKKDVYAAPQTTITVLGKTKKDLINVIKNHAKELVSVYKKSDLKLFQKTLSKEIYDIKKFKSLSKIGFKLKIPKTYYKVEDTDNFLWLRKQIPKGSLNIVAFSFPITNGNDIDGSNVVKYQDSIAKTYIPGQFKGTYMNSAKEFSPYQIPIKLNGIKAFETRGLWEIKGDFMGGPYLNYTLIDTLRNKIITVEGFAYAPSTKKRDYVFELESILKTTKLNYK